MTLFAVALKRLFSSVDDAVAAAASLLGASFACRCTTASSASCGSRLLLALVVAVVVDVVDDEALIPVSE